MICSYGVTRQGTYHIEKGLVCQDAHYIEKISEHFAIAAVADGLGSELYSDVASKIAAEEAVLFCKNTLSENSTEEEIYTTLKDAFKAALKKINETAEKEEKPQDQYDTTLVVAVYLNGNVYFGNAGDSGIVVLNNDGTYEAVTEQQRDEGGLVFPLCFGEKYWKFGMKQNVASVFMATDGMFETLFPYLLRTEEVKIYVALAQYMMDEHSIGFEERGEEAVQQEMEAFIDSIPGNQVNDDKTVLVMLDTEYKADRQEESYYVVPDWTELKRKHDEAFRRAAYPHLYKDEE